MVVINDACIIYCIEWVYHWDLGDVLVAGCPSDRIIYYWFRLLYFSLSPSRFNPQLFQAFYEGAVWIACGFFCSSNRNFQRGADLDPNFHRCFIIMCIYERWGTIAYSQHIFFSIYFFIIHLHTELQKKRKFGVSKHYFMTISAS